MDYSLIFSPSIKNEKWKHYFENNKNLINCKNLINIF